MKILIFGDTHVPHRYKEIPKTVIEEAKKCDLVIFTGDFTDISVLQMLEKEIGKDKFKAVYGNCDPQEIRDVLPETLLLKIKNKRIGVCHGFGNPKEIVEDVKKFLTEKYGKLDIIIFGHSHHPICKEIGGILFINPGSPNDTIYAPFNSYAVLEINKEINAKIVRL